MGWSDRFFSPLIARLTDAGIQGYRSHKATVAGRRILSFVPLLQQGWWNLAKQQDDSAVSQIHMEVQVTNNTEHPVKIVKVEFSDLWPNFYTPRFCCRDWERLTTALNILCPTVRPAGLPSTSWLVASSRAKDGRWCYDPAHGPFWNNIQASTRAH